MILSKLISTGSNAYTLELIAGGSPLRYEFKHVPADHTLDASEKSQSRAHIKQRRQPVRTGADDPQKPLRAPGILLAASDESSSWLRSLSDDAWEDLEECVRSLQDSQEEMQKEQPPLRSVSSGKLIEVNNEKMTPLFIAAESADPESFRVGFDCQGEMVEHVFQVSTDVGVSISGYDDLFWKRLDGEASIARQLFHSIILFYKLARAVQEN